MNRSPIEWLHPPQPLRGKIDGYTWNPQRGCSHVDPGCGNCYAERHGGRFCKPGETFHQIVNPATKTWTGKLRMLPRKAGEPLGVSMGIVFAGSMTDLFHESLPIAWTLELFETMARANWHTFIVLTKRIERALYLLRYGERMALDPKEPAAHHRLLSTMPLPNVIIGVSAHDQASADRRLDVLMQVPAAARVLSLEPCLGPVDLTRWLYPRQAVAGEPPVRLDWVITGGESGRRARPPHPDWFRNVRDQCAAAGVAFLFKQWGEWAPAEDGSPDVARVGKKRAGRLLDGRQHSGFPDLILERIQSHYATVH